MRQVAEFVAVLACALFTGAAFYINLVEHPARMQCGVEIAATEFAPGYRRATAMQATCRSPGLALITRSVARRGYSMVAGSRSAVGLSHSIHADRGPTSSGEPVANDHVSCPHPFENEAVMRERLMEFPGLQRA
jgi:hypothetical protein